MNNVITRKQKVYYAKLINMGDELNKLLIEKLFGYPVQRHTYLTGRISGIGSGLGQFTLHGNAFMRIAERFSGAIFRNVTVWGSGFMQYADKDEPFYRPNIRFAAVRGELSKQRVEKILGHEISVVTGDAGILAPCLIEGEIEKKYTVGIVPHYSEMRGECRSVCEEIKDHYANSILIDVTDDPLQVVRQIGECEVILSSSLHGLIVADGFHIPNRHVILPKSERILRQRFKFDDYYSAYGIEHPYTDLRREALPTVEEIRESYLISAEAVEEKKRQMLDCFPGRRKTP